MDPHTRPFETLRKNHNEVWVKTGVETVLRKLQAAQGGALILQLDHSVTSAVSGRTYDDVVNFIRQRGVYPLDLDGSGRQQGPWST